MQKGTICTILQFVYVMTACFCAPNLLIVHVTMFFFCLKKRQKQGGLETHVAKLHNICPRVNTRKSVSVMQEFNMYKQYRYILFVLTNVTNVFINSQTLSLYILISTRFLCDIKQPRQLIAYLLKAINFTSIVNNIA